MRWRIILAISIIVSWLVYNWVPVDSKLAIFLLSGLAFSVVGRSQAVFLNYLHGRKLHANIKSHTEEEALSATLAENRIDRSTVHRRTEPPVQY